ncbi:unnamed protein product, partial [Mesorhabditis belari]|uniref:Uncharacterized protein n=1 Tax=Mesorhabditis belari TaxID=2138241 RepID=A0AAF3J920_9BILA
MTLISVVSFFGLLSITTALTCHFGVNAPRPRFMIDCKCGQHCVHFFSSGNFWSCGCTIESDGQEHDVCASASPRFACCAGDGCNGQLGRELEAAPPPAPRFEVQRPEFALNCECGQHCTHFLSSGKNIWTCGCSILSGGVRDFCTLAEDQSCVLGR